MDGASRKKINVGDWRMDWNESMEMRLEEDSECGIDERFGIDDHSAIGHVAHCSESAFSVSSTERELSVTCSNAVKKN